MAIECRQVWAWRDIGPFGIRCFAFSLRRGDQNRQLGDGWAKDLSFQGEVGIQTSTDDLEGEVTAATGNVATQQDIEAVLSQFIGAVQQKPPSYSAIKISGERAYDLARAGEVLDLAARTVNIDSLQIEKHDPAGETAFIVQCGKGTYVRSIARDLGRVLGCLGHVTLLRRLSVGPFSENDAISLEKLEELSHKPPSENSLSGILRPIVTVLDGIPALAVMDPEAARLKQGQRVPIQSIGVDLPRDGGGFGHPFGHAFRLVQS